MELTLQWRVIGGSYCAKKKMYMSGGDKYCEKTQQGKGTEDDKLDR